MWQLIVGVLLGAVATVVVLRRATRPSAPVVVEDSSPKEDVANSNESLEALVDALPMGIVVVGKDGQVRFRNNAMSTVTGTRHVDVLVEAATERLIDRALVGKERREEIQLAGPPMRVLEVHAVPLNDGGALALVEDITERWRIDQVRTDFVANVSHELKTPVGAISVLAETLEGETEDELILRLTGRMVLETQRMSRTIDDLLELSRIELGGEALYTSVDMNAVITEVLERVSSLAAKKKVEIVVEQPTNSTLVTGDFFQLTSAIGNLVENAIKYSDTDSTIEVRLRDGSHSMLDVEVEDHGIGIPAESLDRIFERFYRVDRARSRGTGGTGLGLSIVRHVATNHGGEVNVRSREGEGSVFILSIPRVRAAS
jgi:two-component system sensor histidine kinase SenX3